MKIRLIPKRMLQRFAYAIFACVCTGIAAVAENLSNKELGRITFRILDAPESGQPIEGVAITLADQVAGDSLESTQTDTNGIARLRVPQSIAEEAQVVIFKKGYARVHIRLSFELPRNYETWLPPARTVGGQVVDEEGQPVSRADLEVNCTSNKQQRNKNEYYPPADKVNPIVTYGDGQWRSDYATDELIYLSLSVSHPAFAPHFEGVGGGRNAEESFYRFHHFSIKPIGSC